ncbi:substrate-binding domain-containing protein [Robbsia sp. KACC 23696]|uniref:substrate-binding domain-containing protein n=1 Tax=Robbsia sp. KACC 23696 TaxID=3149231 RepID=UPI00325BE0E0
MSSTIKDVALLARCSIATVSRALNTPDKVDPVTLAAVRAAIEASDYRPSALGRMLRAEHSQVIGVVVPTIANPVFGETVQGIDELASAAGYRLMLMTTEYQTDRERAAIDTLRAHRVDGLIVTVADADANEALDALDRAGLPYVLAHNDAPAHSQRRSVAVDNFSAAREAVGEMIARGHTRIRMLAGTLSASDRARQRVAGYEAAMQAAGLSAEPVIEIDFLSDHLSDAVFDALAATGTTGLFCSNDRLALVAVTSLESQGLLVPRDMSVVGFDGLTLGKLLMPRLASVCVPNREIGRRAWASLRDAIRGARTKPEAARIDPDAPASGDAAASRFDAVHERLAHEIRLGGTLGSASPLSRNPLHSFNHKRKPT